VNAIRGPLRASNLQKDLVPLKERIQAIPYGEPLTDALNFRTTRRQAVTLRANALIEGCEISSLIRVLLDEALEARGLGQTL